MSGSADDYKDALLLDKVCTLQNSAADTKMRGVRSTQPLASSDAPHSTAAHHEGSLASLTDKRSLI